MVPEGNSLLQRVVASLAQGAVSSAAPAYRSILAQAATSYAKRPTAAEETIPTGFDPRAAVLFEAVIEAAFLVANSDGEFDEQERRTFETVVAQACRNTLQPHELHELVSELCRVLQNDGMARRVGLVCQAVSSHEHRLEVLRIAALMAHVSGGVKDAERAVLRQLAEGMGLGADAVQTALDHAEQALRGE